MTEKTQAAELSAPTLVGDVRDMLLQRAKFDNNPLPWDARSEKEQQETVRQITEFAQDLVEKAVRVVASGGRRVIIMKLDSVDTKAKLIMVKAHVPREEKNRHALADAVGGELLGVIATAAEFQGERAAVEIRHDQGDLVADLAVPLEDWTELGDEEDSWPKDRPVHLAKFAGKDLLKSALGYWHDGDTTAGWAEAGDRGLPKPIGFEPTHWRDVRVKDEGPAA